MLTRAFNRWQMQQSETVSIVYQDNHKYDEEFHLAVSEAMDIRDRSTLILSLKPF
jgi:hypothetical protein